MGPNMPSQKAESEVPPTAIVLSKKMSSEQEKELPRLRPETLRMAEVTASKLTGIVCGPSRLVRVGPSTMLPGCGKTSAPMPGVLRSSHDIGVFSMLAEGVALHRKNDWLKKTQGSKPTAGGPPMPPLQARIPAFVAAPARWSLKRRSTPDTGATLACQSLPPAPALPLLMPHRPGVWKAMKPPISTSPGCVLPEMRSWGIDPIRKPPELEMMRLWAMAPDWAASTPNRFWPRMELPLVTPPVPKVAPVPPEAWLPPGPVISRVQAR